MELDSSFSKGGDCAAKFITEIKAGRYNVNPLRDYYFLVALKDKKEVIAQSVLGLSNITANKSNLPFQVRWSNNKQYTPHSAKEFAINWQQLYATKRSPTWQQKLLDDLNDLNDLNALKL